jgi:hypothetical protein
MGALGGEVVANGDGSVTVASIRTTGPSNLRGTSATHATSTVVAGSDLAIYSDPTASAMVGRYGPVRVESLVPTTAFATQGYGLYTGRFLVGIQAASTFKGSANQAYLIGVQGKLTMTATSVMGDGNSGGIFAAAGLMQMQIAAGATFGADTNVSGLWVDNQIGAALPAASQLLNLTNNGGAITTVMHVYGNNAVSFFLTAENLGGACVAATGVTTIGKALKVQIDGTTYYVPLCTGTT